MGGGGSATAELMGKASMRRHLVLAAMAALLLPPLEAVAQGRGDAHVRGPDRRAERPFERPGNPNAARAPRPAPRQDLGPPAAWRRGQVLPPTYRGGAAPNLERHHLRPPPPGYDWVQVGPDIYLTQRSTGLVLEAIPGGY